MAEGFADIAGDCRRRRIGFVLRRWPDHRLDQFCREVRPALVVGDENPLDEAEAWRVKSARLLTVPLWSVDADVIAPTRLLEKAQYAARTIRPRLARLLPRAGTKFRSTPIRTFWTDAIRITRGCRNCRGRSRG